MSLLETFLIIHFFLLHPVDAGTYDFDSGRFSYRVTASESGLKIEGTNHPNELIVSCLDWNYLECKSLINPVDPFTSKKPIIRISDDRTEKEREIDLSKLGLNLLTNHGSGDIREVTLSGITWHYAESENAIYYTREKPQFRFTVFKNNKKKETKVCKL